MLLSQRIPLGDLILLSRAMRHGLSAGLTLRDVFRQQSNRGPAAVRPVAEHVVEQVEQGESLASALEEQSHKFPPLFLSLIEVGEESGNLPEVMAELEKYLMLQQKLRRQFIGQIAWPVIQLIGAIFVIAGMIFILGILGSGFDPLGFGLTGSHGAMMWLVFCFGGLALLLAVYFVLTRTLQQKALVDEVLLRIPILGPTLHALALMRFSVALQLTSETGMPIKSALKLSLRGTGNSAYIARMGPILDAIRAGDDLAAALDSAGIFPEDYINIIAVAEEGGRLTDTLKHQASYYEEEAARRMTILTRVAAWGVWLCVAILIIFLIFRIMMTYMGILSSFGV